jgi:hypothetical protein
MSIIAKRVSTELDSVATLAFVVESEDDRPTTDVDTFATVLCVADKDEPSSATATFVADSDEPRSATLESVDDRELLRFSTVEWVDANL